MTKKSAAITRIKDRLARQSTWTTFATTAAAAAVLVPAYSVPLGVIALVAGLVKPFLAEDSTASAPSDTSEK